MKQIVRNWTNDKAFDLNRMRLTIGDAKGPALANKRESLLVALKAANADVDQKIKVVFKDLGRQVSWTTVFLVEYFGPILVSCLFAVFQKQIYGESRELNLSQKLGFLMLVGHYVKRELETLFVHRFSNDTMPFFNLFKNSFHYWVLNGSAAYFLLHPKYSAPEWASDSTKQILFGLFWLFEFMNGMCHITLRNLRPPGTRERNIPYGWGFSQISCANYFWEALCWITFSIQTQVAMGYVFTLVSAGQMFLWAIKKHKAYKKDFGTKYPRRSCMFPGDTMIMKI
jgi:very-long-chain enoyl-CoA reductase